MFACLMMSHTSDDVTHSHLTDRSNYCTNLCTTGLLLLSIISNLHKTTYNILSMTTAPMSLMACFVGKDMHVASQTRTVTGKLVLKILILGPIFSAKILVPRTRFV